MGAFVFKNRLREPIKKRVNYHTDLLWHGIRLKMHLQDVRLDLHKELQPLLSKM